MKINNPAVIPRNYRVEEALDDVCNKSDLALVKNLLKYIKTPYESHDGIDYYQNSPKTNNEKYKTFCGT